MESIKEICKSLRNDSGSWTLTKKDDPDRNYKYCLSVTHKKSNIALTVFRESPFDRYNCIVFSKKSPIHLGRLRWWWDQWILWRAIRACQYNQIKEALKPRKYIKRDQKIFCPSCGEEISFDLIEDVMEDPKNEPN